MPLHFRRVHSKICLVLKIVLNYAVYGFGSDNFTRPEAQFPYDVPFGYFKGPKIKFFFFFFWERGGYFFINKN